MAGEAGPPAHRRYQATAPLIWAALAVVYVVWGRFTIETLPPMLSASFRFLVAGGLLYAFAIRRGDRDADRPGLP